jgi:hypothetical protein
MSGIELLPANGDVKMRGVVFGILGLMASAGITQCCAQNILKAEPFILAPYEVVLVADASCMDGKVLRVTGAIRGLRRKKSCVAMGGVTASLGVMQ